ncbi:DUF937 domain-containing protein [Xanthobacter agilis]|uniref:DUF937 domain-containing protein n=1 Tax=Xanthobacter agilis TaxID=47492 RepID=A0ABU0LCL5_XANAG|nr:DUF937 domain-containing protein [Xanthobacter agilis]MDQ0504866.1 hypothetical protein [Xanthobacter agilis]
MDQFVELLRAAQGGHGMENLARVYGLSTQQAKAVADALMPAFADNFRHVTQSPEAMASLMALMLNGPYGAYYGNPNGFGAPYGTQQAPPPPPRQPQPDINQMGMDALNAVFGSSEVSRAVASQVAATTGLGIAMVRQMMPTFANLFVGGLAKSLAASGALQTVTAALLSRLPIGQPEARPAPISSGNPWIDAFLAFSATSASAPSYSSGNPWADAFARVMFQQAAPASPQQRANPANAWQDVVNAMASTLAQTGAPAPSPVAPPAPPAPSPQPYAPQDAAANPLQPFQEFFAKMFAQGFPPNFPGAANPERPPYTFPEFWMDVLARTRQPGTEAEIIPPEKPRLVKKDGDEK